MYERENTMIRMIVWLNSWYLVVLSWSNPFPSSTWQDTSHQATAGQWSQSLCCMTPGYIPRPHSVPDMRQYNREGRVFLVSNNIITTPVLSEQWALLINDPFLSCLALWLTALCWVVNPEVRHLRAPTWPGPATYSLKFSVLCHCLITCLSLTLYHWSRILEVS